MQFKEVIGQQSVKERLTQSVDRGRISHAQLFVGDQGVGALPMAIAYAQYVNCPNRAQGDSCGVCPSCHQIAQLAHPDLHCVFPVNTPKGKSSSEKPISNHFMTQWRETVRQGGGYFNEQQWYEAIEIDNKQGNISTFEADEIIRSLSFKAFESEYKIVLIWLCERMNTQAANKLLKILEEPWDKTLFLLVSEAPDRLLPTILSRTQVVQVPAITLEEMERYLVQVKGVDTEQAQRIARLSRGSILEAERCLREVASGEGDELFGLFVQLMRLSYEDRHLELLEWADTVCALGREEQKRLMINSIRLLRDSYMLTAGVPEISFLFGKEHDFCKRFAPFVNNKNIEALVAEMELVIRQIGQNGSAKVIFPHFALTVSKLIGAR